MASIAATDSRRLRMFEGTAKEDTVQLHNEKTGFCWGSTFTGSQISKKDGVKGLFKAKAQ